MKKLLLITALLAPCVVFAGEVEIVDVVLKKSGDTWRVGVTLKHADSGWDHYADGWRLVDQYGKEIGMRVLYHPHVHEQPFTRYLDGVHIPEDTKTLFVEAHDKLHGWTPNRVQIDMTRPLGDKYKIIK